MFGKKSSISPLELRKQLLIAESELNRAHLAQDLNELTADVRTFTNRARSFGSIASGAAVLIATLSTFKRRKPLAHEAKPRWLQTVIEGASVISGLWLAFRARSGRTDT